MCMLHLAAVDVLRSTILNLLLGSFLEMDHISLDHYLFVASLSC